MIKNFNSISWKSGENTEEYVRRHAYELKQPAFMKDSALVFTMTHCGNLVGWNNPYATEILKRTGMQRDYDMAKSNQEKHTVIERACIRLGYAMMY